MKSLVAAIVVISSLSLCPSADAQFTDAQLARWLKRFPEADANQDGRLTVVEAQAYRKKLRSSRGKTGGPPKTFKVDPGWQKDRFPEHAVCYKSPDEIAELYAQLTRGRDTVIRYEKPSDGSLRIVGTGHSFMAPGYKTFPVIVWIAE